MWWNIRNYCPLAITKNRKNNFYCLIFTWKQMGLISTLFFILQVWTSIPVSTSYFDIWSLRALQMLVKPLFSLVAFTNKVNYAILPETRKSWENGIEKLLRTETLPPNSLNNIWQFWEVKNSSFEKFQALKLPKNTIFATPKLPKAHKAATPKL